MTSETWLTLEGTVDVTNDAGEAGQPGPRWLTAEEQVAWRAYLRGSRLLELALDHDLQEHGLSLSEYEIISMLSEHADRRMRMSELADFVVQSRSRLTHTATRLERRGWVRREPCESDRRGVELVLTRSGATKVLEMAQSHVDSVRTHLIDPLSAEQYAALGSAMATIRDMIRPGRSPL